MPLLRLTALLVAVLALLPSCRKQSGHGYFLSLYRTESEQAFKSTSAAFMPWLLSHGFSARPSPGGMAERSGMHSDGDASAWYETPVGNHVLMLRITTNRDQRHISASTDYRGAYSDTELAEMRRRNQKVWFDIIAWFEEHAEQNAVANDPEKWFSDARRDVTKAYTE